MNIAVILPVFEPDDKFNIFADGLVEAGFKDIIVINDGSSPEKIKHFEEAARHSEVTLLTHEVNRGKGAALKTAFSYLLENRKDIDAAVTCDGDGQHDVVRFGSCETLEQRPRASEQFRDE